MIFTQQWVTPILKRSNTLSSFASKHTSFYAKVNAIEAFELNKIVNKCFCEFIGSGSINLHQVYHN
jgi:hypothetical protein